MFRPVFAYLDLFLPTRLEALGQLRGQPFLKRPVKPMFHHGQPLNADARLGFFRRCERPLDATDLCVVLDHVIVAAYVHA